MLKIWEAGLLDEIDLKLTMHDELDFSAVDCYNKNV